LGFFSGLKNGQSNSPQTSNQAFLAVFTAISQLKNPEAGLSGSQECISCWLNNCMTCTYANENKELPRGFAGRIFKE